MFHKMRRINIGFTPFAVCQDTRHQVLRVHVLRVRAVLILDSHSLLTRARVENGWGMKNLR